MDKVSAVLQRLITLAVGVLAGIVLTVCQFLLSGREPGNVGGEIFILPMIAGLFWLGWSMGRQYERDDRPLSLKGRFPCRKRR
ncbi:MAG: hypothetical protein ACK5LX_13950 [Oscillospiraceae bacterium]